MYKVSTYDITGQPGDEGGYQCRAENTEDAVDAGAEVRVVAQPSLTKQPVSTTAHEKVEKN